jgi:hypothetical protein
MIDTARLKMEYELMGLSREELAHTHGISPEMLDISIKEGKWLRKVNGERDADLTAIAKQSDIARRVKDSALVPYYTALEISILSKAKQMVDHVDVTETGAAAKIKAAAEIYQNLLGKNLIAAGDNQSAGIQINILTAFSDGQQSACVALQPGPEGPALAPGAGPSPHPPSH